MFPKSMSRGVSISSPLGGVLIVLAAMSVSAGGKAGVALEWIESAPKDSSSTVIMYIKYASLSYTSVDIFGVSCAAIGGVPLMVLRCNQAHASEQIEVIGIPIVTSGKICTYFQKEHEGGCES